mgnify:CR=1 FL=1
MSNHKVPELPFSVFSSAPSCRQLLLRLTLRERSTRAKEATWRVKQMETKPRLGCGWCVASGRLVKGVPGFVSPVCGVCTTAVSHCSGAVHGTPHNCRAHHSRRQRQLFYERGDDRPICEFVGAVVLHLVFPVLMFLCVPSALHPPSALPPHQPTQPTSSATASGGAFSQLRPQGSLVKLLPSFQSASTATSGSHTQQQQQQQAGAPVTGTAMSRVAAIATAAVVAANKLHQAHAVVPDMPPPPVASVVAGATSPGGGQTLHGDEAARAVPNAVPTSTDPPRVPDTATVLSKSASDSGTHHASGTSRHSHMHESDDNDNGHAAAAAAAAVAPTTTAGAGAGGDAPASPPVLSSRSSSELSFTLERERALARAHEAAAQYKSSDEEDESSLPPTSRLFAEVAARERQKATATRVTVVSQNKRGSTHGGGDDGDDDGGGGGGGPVALAAAAGVDQRAVRPPTTAGAQPPSTPARRADATVHPSTNALAPPTSLATPETQMPSPPPPLSRGHDGSPEPPRHHITLGTPGASRAARTDHTLDSDHAAPASPSVRRRDSTGSGARKRKGPANDDSPRWARQLKTPRRGVSINRKRQREKHRLLQEDSHEGQQPHFPPLHWRVFFVQARGRAPARDGRVADASLAELPNPDAQLLGVAETTAGAACTIGRRNLSNLSSDRKRRIARQHVLARWAGNGLELKLVRATFSSRIRGACCVWVCEE